MRQLQIIDMPERPVARDDLVEELIDQELFLYDEDTGETHCLNSGAAIVWLLCDGTRNVKEIVQEIATTYALPEDGVLADVRDAIGQFRSLGILRG